MPGIWAVLNWDKGITSGLGITEDFNSRDEAVAYCEKVCTADTYSWYYPQMCNNLLSPNSGHELRPEDYYIHEHCLGRNSFHG